MPLVSPLTPRDPAGPGSVREPAKKQTEVVTSKTIALPSLEPPAPYLAAAPGWDPWDTEWSLSGFCRNLFDCLCYPDLCYEPCWLPVADAAFSVDAVRPVNQVRFRWDWALNWPLPDRAEYFWARADGKGRGPQPPPGRFVVDRVRYHDINLYTEAALERFSVFVDGPYRSVHPDDAPHAANFSDMRAGCKSLLFDCELLQVGFQFTTHIPTGNEAKGLGTGHVSIEPSLLVGLFLTCDTYWQGQVAEWIPIGGDPAYQGSILHYHFSLNQVLHRFRPEVSLIGTLECNGWTFQDGAYTDPQLGALQNAGGDTYVSVGGGIRLFIGDRFDLGFAALFGVTEPHFYGQMYRTEVRWRF